MDGPPSLRECLRPGPSAQLRPLHGSGLPANRLPDKTQEIPQRKEAVAAKAADETNTDEQNFCRPTEGRPEIATASDETERVDIEGDVEACQRESLRAPGPKERTGAKKTPRATN